MIETLPTLLQSIAVTIPSQIRREENKVTYHLANVGIETMNGDINDTWHNVTSTSIGTACTTLVQRDWTHNLE